MQAFRLDGGRWRPQAILPGESGAGRNEVLQMVMQCQRRAVPQRQAGDFCRPVSAKARWGASTLLPVPAAVSCSSVPGIFRSLSRVIALFCASGYVVGTKA
jgi:hypothetical protein